MDRRIYPCIHIHAQPALLPSSFSLVHLLGENPLDTWLRLKEKIFGATVSRQNVEPFDFHNASEADFLLCLKIDENNEMFLTQAVICTSRFYITRSQGEKMGGCFFHSKNYERLFFQCTVSRIYSFLWSFTFTTRFLAECIFTFFYRFIFFFFNQTSKVFTILLSHFLNLSDSVKIELSWIDLFS